MPSPTTTAAPPARPLLRSVLALVRSELRLVLREPLVLAFVFAFPIVTVLVIAGSFEGNDDGFGGVEPHSGTSRRTSRW